MYMIKYKYNKTKTKTKQAGKKLIFPEVYLNFISFRGKNGEA